MAVAELVMAPYVAGQPKQQESLAHLNHCLALMSQSSEEAEREAAKVVSGKRSDFFRQISERRERIQDHAARASALAKAAYEITYFTNVSEDTIRQIKEHLSGLRTLQGIMLMVYVHDSRLVAQHNLPKDAIKTYRSAIADLSFVADKIEYVFFSPLSSFNMLSHLLESVGIQSMALPVRHTAFMAARWFEELGISDAVMNYTADDSVLFEVRREKVYCSLEVFADGDIVYLYRNAGQMPEAYDISQGEVGARIEEIKQLVEA